MINSELLERAIGRAVISILEESTTAVIRTSGATLVTPVKRGPGRPRKAAVETAPKPAKLGKSAKKTGRKASTKVSAKTAAKPGAKRAGRPPKDPGLADKVLPLIASEAAMTVPEIVKQLGSVTPDAVRTAIKVLLGRGTVVKATRGTFTATNGAPPPVAASASQEAPASAE